MIVDWLVDQIGRTNVILINKTDLGERSHLSIPEAIIRSLSPDAKILYFEYWNLSEMEKGSLSVNAEPRQKLSLRVARAYFAKHPRHGSPA